MHRQQKLFIFCHQTEALVTRIRYCRAFSRPALLGLPGQMTSYVMQKLHDSVVFHTQKYLQCIPIGYFLHAAKGMP